MDFSSVTFAKVFWWGSRRKAVGLKSGTFEPIVEGLLGSSLCRSRRQGDFIFKLDESWFDTKQKP